MHLIFISVQLLPYYSSSLVTTVSPINTSCHLCRSYHQATWNRVRYHDEWLCCSKAAKHSFKISYNVGVQKRF